MTGPPQLHYLYSHYTSRRKRSAGQVGLTSPRTPIQTTIYFTPDTDMGHPLSTMRSSEAKAGAPWIGTLMGLFSPLWLPGSLIWRRRLPVKGVFYFYVSFWLSIFPFFFATPCVTLLWLSLVAPPPGWPPALHAHRLGLLVAGNIPESGYLGLRSRQDNLHWIQIIHKSIGLYSPQRVFSLVGGKGFFGEGFFPWLLLLLVLMLFAFFFLVFYFSFCLLVSFLSIMVLGHFPRWYGT